MSAPQNPALSPFVRGTAADVYFLSAGVRRLIPDSQTLAFLLAGQTVRTLADADLNAIPLGTPVPSRKDGTLLTQKFVAPPPAIVTYFMASGQRRRVPDLATQLLFTRAGLQAAQVELADLASILEGPPLPTRKDGTLYQGTAGVFAYVLEGGLKRALPDATTLRDAAFDFHNLLPITPTDLSLIPDGAAFPSTSRFFAPPDSRVPLVLLPVRIETRFQNNQLLLRVYPDNIHADAFEPGLTAAEQDARAGYLALSPTDSTARQTAFAALARQFGPARAAWITSANAPSTTKAADWTTAPFTSVLPERWIVLGYLGNQAGQVIAVGPPIPESLALGPAAPNPSASGLTPISPGLSADPGSKWISDFDTAIQVGMAFRIPLTGAATRGFSRVVVVGLKTKLSPSDSAASLGALLDAHHFTDGLELLPHNALTNNIEDSASSFTSSDPDYARIFSIEQGSPLCPARPSADGDRLARALGVTPALFAHVAGADGAQDEQAAAMNTVLWPATWGYYLSQLVAAAVPNPTALLPAAYSHFDTYVRARGHFPALRVGRQPYGILPVCWSAGWQPLEGRVLDAPLFGLLARLRSIWSAAVPGVARIPNSPDPEAALVGVLGMAPASISYMVRALIGPEYNFAYWNFVKADLPQDWWNTLARATQVDNTSLGSAMASTRLASAAYVTWPRPLSDIFVGPAPLDGQAVPGFVKALAGDSWQDLLNPSPDPSAPTPILFLLLRHSALRQYLETALDLLIAAGVAQPSERMEAEMVGFEGIPLRPTATDILQSAITISGRAPLAVGVLLDASKADPTLPGFSAFWTAFNRLATFSAADLDAAGRETLDLACYRLDSWITSLAAFRLDQSRAANPAAGIILGGYGYVENVSPFSPLAPSAGFVHAPSLNHSVSSAVLRAGYLAHAGGSQRPFEIDLSSARVRLALHLLDGVREGQSLGALLGYRLERTLNDSGAAPLVETLRTYAPMTSASHLDVVDGLSLLRKFNANQTQFWMDIGLSQTGTPQRKQVATAITLIEQALDSVADLTLAESVHQLTRGNTLRAGAVLDNIARGDAPPPEIDFVQTPFSGSAVTHRLMTAAIGNTTPHWSVTPRAQAEPRLNVWAASLLGDPAMVRIRLLYAGADGSAPGSLEIGLNQLALAPVDLLALAETGAEPGGEMTARIVRAGLQLRPATVPATAQVQLVPARDPAWPPQTIGLPEWLGLLQSVGRLTAGARALGPADLIVAGDNSSSSPAAIDTELQGRADAAETSIRAALQAIQQPAASDAALFGAAAFGINGSVPDPDPARWPLQLAAVSAELISRTRALDQLAAGFVRSSANPDGSRDYDIARLKAIFGASFLVLPLLAPADAARWPQLWSNTASLQGSDALAPVRWLQRAARLRPGIARFDAAIMFAEALSGQSILQFQLAQLPTIANDRWAGLDTPGAAPVGNLSLALFSPTPFSAGAPIAGLMLDEWIEVRPSTEQITGVSFQYTGPGARAPQSLLLAVPPDDFPEWTLASLEGSVLEALDLARIRAVDPDVLLNSEPATPVDSNVKDFQFLSTNEAFVLTADGNLWLDHGPFGAASPARDHVDVNVASFQALSDSELVILSTDGSLWLASAPFGNVPPTRRPIDRSVALTPPVASPPPPPPPPPTKVAVPNLVEMSAALAVKALEAVKLVPKLSGLNTGVSWVASQSPAAGQVVNVGSTVSLVLSTLARR